jgi:triosephosphate isomerase
LEIREQGGHIGHCSAQLDADLAGLPAEQVERIVIAYEPIWAIGTGKVATPDDAQEVCAAIRTRVGELYSPELAAGARVLYGGSVKAANAGEILKQEDIDGALVGGASLDPEEFTAIVVAAGEPVATRS